MDPSFARRKYGESVAIDDDSEYNILLALVNNVSRGFIVPEYIIFSHIQCNWAVGDCFKDFLNRFTELGLYELERTDRKMYVYRLKASFSPV